MSYLVVSFGTVSSNFGDKIPTVGGLGGDRQQRKSEGHAVPHKLTVNRFVPASRWARFCISLLLYRLLVVTPGSQIESRLACVKDLTFFMD